MNSQKIGLQVAGTIFGLMALAQLARLVIRPDIIVAGFQMPLWPSALAVIVMGVLSLWMWKLSRRRDTLSHQGFLPAIRNKPGRLRSADFS